MRLHQTFQGVLNSANPVKTFRVCHWDPAVSRLPVGSKIRVRFEVNSVDLMSMAVEVKELYQATGNPGQFNPGGPMRNLDRDLRNTDAYLVIDPSTLPDLAQGETLWQQAGAFPAVSPEYEMSRSDDHELTLVLSRIGADVGYTVNVFVDF